MSPAADILKPGQIARVRQRTYLVEQIVKPKRAADSTLVKLSCVDDDNQGQPLEILWEKELDPHVLTAESWGTIASKGFDDSNLFAAYLNTLKWNCVTSTDPKLFQSPFRAGIRLDALLDEYRQTREERLKNETKRSQAASGLLIVELQQRERTPPFDLDRELPGQVAAEAIGPYDVNGPWTLDLLAGSVDNDDDRATLEEDQLRAEEDAQFEAASAASLGSLEDLNAQQLFAHEQKLLDEMTEVAEQARGKSDARVEKFVAWIRDKMCPDLGKPGAPWNDLRVLIFTEYDDTKRYLVGRLQAAIDGSDRAEQRIQIFHGPTPPAKREEIKQAFITDPSKAPLRILIATDAAREGLNLQAYCHHLFHFDVPWNPSRMEQRNGRIDRKLQPKDEVFCHYFVYKQRPEDRILQVLVRKTERLEQLREELRTEGASTLRRCEIGN